MVTGVGQSFAVSASGTLGRQRQDLAALKSALDSGDLAGAQQAFAQFKTDFHAAHGGKSLYQTGVPETVKQDLQGLQSALASGDLAGAQQVFAQFVTDFKAGRPSPTQPPPSVPASTPGDPNGSLNVMA